MFETWALLWRYEWKAFVRNRLQLGMLLAFFGLGLYAIYYGHDEIEAQRETLEQLAALERDEFAGYTASFAETLTDDEHERARDIATKPAYAWYRHGYHATLPPEPYAALAIGQRDLFRYYYRLTGTSLYYQLFENELANPVNLLVGNFDLSFVLVYLFPLVVIVFCYGLFAADRERGTLPLLLIQPVSMRTVTLARLGFYAFVLTGLALALTVIGLLVAGGVPRGEGWPAALAWIGSVLAYALFRFGLLYAITGLRQGSAASAMMAAACWLLLLIVLPSKLNTWVTVRYPLSSATLADLTRRTGLENEDDEAETGAVIAEFLAHRPDLNPTDSSLQTDRMAKAYAAFTFLKDMGSRREVEAYEARVRERATWTARWGTLTPATAVQEALARSSGTDLETSLRFQTALTDFHGEIVDFYIPRLFRDEPIQRADYEARPVFKMPRPEGRWAGVLQLLWPVAVLGAVGLAIGGWLYGRAG